jgi:8-oxo-dGTP pyrophosphatase MutT (NUDIX family)
MASPPMTPDPLHLDAVRVLSDWSAPTPAQDMLRLDYLSFLDAHPDAMTRGNRVGHLTGSALVVDTGREAVLLTLHPLVGRWLQLGGHVEASDATLVDAARRESIEEGGIDPVDIDTRPLRLDRHRVRCRDGRGGEDLLDHLDVQFLVLTPPGSVEQRSSESLDLRWWPWSALPDGTDDSVRALVQEARGRLGA